MLMAVMVVTAAGGDQPLAVPPVLLGSSWSGCDRHVFLPVSVRNR